MIPSITKFVMAFQLIIWMALPTFSQVPIEPPVCLPVYLSDSYAPQEQVSDLPKIAELSGVALLFLDTSDQKDHLIVNKPDFPIIWYDKVGISTRVTFIRRDSLKENSLELVFSNTTCSANIIMDGEKIASGTISIEYGRPYLKLIGNESYINDISQFIVDLNQYLLRLHTYKLKEIQLQSILNRDSLNVIVGVDYQFNTNFDLLWFDESIRHRVKMLGEMTYSKLIAGGEDPAVLQDTIENVALVTHNARLLPGNRSLMTGSISTIFEVSNTNDYYFLRSGKPYLLKINYKYNNYLSGEDRLNITGISIRNMDTDDFVEMDIFDFTDSGFPILYVDLIRSVVMEDLGTWNIYQVLQVIQDVFRLIRLPNEGGG